ncbi:MAG: CotH kinase family protein [Bacillota bacterium]|nr:CotH kinase family protein [Bacillota bacterium]
MKKIWFMILSVLSLVLYLNLGNVKAAFDRNIMNVKVLSIEEIESLCEGKEETFLYPDITFSDAAIAYDMEQNMLLLPQSLLEKDFQGRLKASDGRLYFLWDEALEDKAEAMRQNKVFRLYWIREDQCWMYNVYFTGMPILCLTELSQDGEESSGRVWVYDQYRSTGSYGDLNCKWHVRGASTRDYAKSGYRLTLTDRKVSFLGMREDDDWILNALYDDEGLIHNKLSYEVWQRIAGSNHVSGDEGISMEYVEMFMNDQYLGVYGLLERIDKKELSLSSRDILYKCNSDEEPGEDDFYSVLTDEMNPVFVMKYPSECLEENWEPLRRWSSLFLTEEIVDYQLGRDILNMENAVDYNLFNLLICGMDNTMKNVYFWADCEQDGSYQFIKIPWDLNMTWGNSWIDDPACKFNKYQEKNLERAAGWTPDIYLLYECNPMETGYLLSSRWKELREDIITKESLTDMVSMQYEYLYSSGAYQRNSLKWPSEGNNWSDEYIYEYIDKRIDFLDGYIGQMGQ